MKFFITQALYLVWFIFAGFHISKGTTLIYPNIYRSYSEITKKYLFGLRYKVYEEKTHCQKCKKIFAIDARLNFNLYGTRTYLLFLN